MEDLLKVSIFTMWFALLCFGLLWFTLVCFGWGRICIIVNMSGTQPCLICTITSRSILFSASITRSLSFCFKRPHPLCLPSPFQGVRLLCSFWFLFPFPFAFPFPWHIIADYSIASSKHYSSVCLNVMYIKSSVYIRTHT